MIGLQTLKTSNDTKQIHTMFNEITEFIRELYGAEGFIPLHGPTFNGNEKIYLEDCIDSTFVSSVGKYVDQFEASCAKVCGSKFAIATSNGTTALQVALKLADVRPGDEVITQSLSFVATANAIAHLGATPIFIDIDRDNLSLSPDAVEKYLELHADLDNQGRCINKLTGKIIKACVPMHTFGFMAKMTPLVGICRKYGIALVEDAAEALGSHLNGKMAGSFGKMGILSFNGNKILTTGGGGIILTDDEVLAKRAKHITTTAKVQHPWEFSHDEIGYNYRLPNVNAAIGVAQLECLEERLVLKRKLFVEYKKFFEASDNLPKLWQPSEGEGPNFWLNALVFSSHQEREGFLKYSNERGVMTRPVWKPLHSLEIYSNAQRGDMINTEFFYERVVNIPSTPIFK